MSWNQITRNYYFKHGFIGSLRVNMPTFLWGISSDEHRYATKIYNYAQKNNHHSFGANHLMELISTYELFHDPLFNEQGNHSHIDLLKQLAAPIEEYEWITELQKVIRHYPLLEKAGIAPQVITALSDSGYQYTLNYNLEHSPPTFLTDLHLPFFVSLKEQLSLFVRNKLAFLFKKHNVVLKPENEFYSSADEKELFKQRGLNRDVRKFFEAQKTTKDYSNNSPYITPEKLINITEHNVARIKFQLSQLPRFDKAPNATNLLLYTTLAQSVREERLAETIEKFKRFNMTFTLEHFILSFKEEEKADNKLLILMIEQAEAFKAVNQSALTDYNWQKLFESLKKQGLIFGMFEKLVSNYYKSADLRENLSRAELVPEWLAFLNDPQPMEALSKIDNFHPLKISLHETILKSIKAFIEPHLEKMTAFERDVLGFKKSVHSLFTGDHRAFGRSTSSEQIKFILQLTLKPQNEKRYQTELAAIRELVNSLIKVCGIHESDESITTYEKKQAQERMREAGRIARQEAKRQHLSEMLREVRQGTLGFTSRDQIAELCTNADGEIDQEMYTKQCRVFRALNALY